VPELDRAIDWLLSSDEPSVRFLTRRDVLGERVEPDPEEILAGPKVTALLAGQQPNGGFTRHPYRKWTGAHWRLVSLVELSAPPGEPRLLAAVETVLSWLTGRGRLHKLSTSGDELPRRHASLEGNALAVCSRIGLTGDQRVEQLARSLVAWQWPDGGWNCDRDATGRRSSFHESLIPAWGLHEYSRVTGARWAAAAADRAAELFLSHRLFRALDTGKVINRQWIALHYPPYWHYDILHALIVLTRLGRVADPRTADAIELIAGAQRRDGLWQAGGYWWRGTSGSILPEAVDWGRGGPNEMITLNAVRVLSAASAGGAPSSGR
jgi:hypothetical protein